ncbi:zinc ion binding protein [Sesbania bispinosa]|nr:zinc ion binding protein [Sesbania bispinosa]
MTSRQRSYSSNSVSGRRLCGCGEGIVTLTSRSAKNPGRKFFRTKWAAISSNGSMKNLEEVKEKARVDANVIVLIF